MTPKTTQRSWNISDLWIRVQDTGQVITTKEKQYCTIKQLSPFIWHVTFTLYWCESQLILKINRKNRIITIINYLETETINCHSAVYLGNKVLFPDVKKGCKGQKRKLLKTITMGSLTHAGAPPKPPRKPLPNQIPFAENLKITKSKIINYDPKQSFASLIILNYNTLELLPVGIASILKNTIYPYELIVVDNASSDQSISWLKRQPYLKLIKNHGNFGWAKGNNIAIKKSKGAFFVLLNSDVFARHKGWLTQMVNYAMTSSRIGTVGAKLFYPHRRIQHIGGAIHSGSPHHPFEGAPISIQAAYKSRNVPFNTGACLLIKRSTIKKVGYLNEEYRFGYSDVDYGLKVVMKNLRNVFCPKAVLTHFWAYTQRKTGKGIPQSAVQLYLDNWKSKLSILNRKVKLDWGWPEGVTYIKKRQRSNEFDRQFIEQKKKEFLS